MKQETGAGSNGIIQTEIEKQSSLCVRRVRTDDGDVCATSDYCPHPRFLNLHVMNVHIMICTL
jgi:nitrite reductase/ring-hydroxylating ferredoxin subunit